METKDFQKEYEEKGAYHHRLTGFRKMWFDRNCRMLTEGIGGKILDIACGDGCLVDYIGDFSHVDGFDLSVKAVELARKKRIYRNLWQENIVEEKNYYKYGPYDFYICSLSLQYIAEEQLIEHFKCMRDVLSDISEYRFSFPNTKKVSPPKVIKKILEYYFKYVEMKTITGFIENADSLDYEQLVDAFSRAKDSPVEDSYHYMVSLRKG